MTTQTRALLMVLAGIASVQIGAAFAKGLFTDAGPTTVAWLRLMLGSLILLAWVRPRLRDRSRADWLVAVGFGLTLGLMNWSFYQSISRIPIGVAVTIEFLGPLAVAIASSRRRSDFVWAGLAALGVALLGGLPDHLDPVGGLYAALAGAAWAGYLLLSANTGRRWPGLDGLAVASLVAGLLLTPGALLSGALSRVNAHVLTVALLVAVLSSVIPYSLELMALRAITPGMLGILMSLEPAAAALAAMAVLGEFVAPLGWVAMACVVTASIGATRASTRQVSVNAAG